MRGVFFSSFLLFFFSPFVFSAEQVKCLDHSDGTTLTLGEDVARRMVHSLACTSNTSPGAHFNHNAYVTIRPEDYQETEELCSSPQRIYPPGYVAIARSHRSNCLDTVQNNGSVFNPDRANAYTVTRSYSRRYGDSVEVCLSPNLGGGTPDDFAITSRIHKLQCDSNNPVGSLSDPDPTHANTVVLTKLGGNVGDRFTVCNFHIPTGFKNVGSTYNAQCDFDTTINVINGHSSQGALIVERVDPRILAKNDFNGDGTADILWRNSSTGENKFYNMNGTTTLSQNYFLSTNNVWLIKETGDFNGDGKVDILLYHSVIGQSYLWLMDGDNIIGYGQVSTLSDLAWQIKGAGDFNGDGKTDILWLHEDTGQYMIYFMNGTTIISQGIYFTINDSNWDVSGVGDFNGDSKDDILFRHRVNGQVWTYLMNGSTIASSLHVAYTGLDWNIEGVGDFNNDKKEDLLWKNSQNGRVWIYMMNGATILESDHVAYTGLVWEVKAIGDYNGDGVDDITWRNKVTGQNWMYLMDEFNILKQAEINSEPDLNWEIK